MHENLAQLELLNKQYRRLARENRVDQEGRLKQQVLDANRRWDELSGRQHAIIRRLKHSLSLKEDFDMTRESLQVWLTEMDLALTNMEHFSHSQVTDKIKQVQVRPSQG